MAAVLNNQSFAYEDNSKSNANKTQCKAERKLVCRNVHSFKTGVQDNKPSETKMSSLHFAGHK